MLRNTYRQTSLTIISIVAVMGVLTVGAASSLRSTKPKVASYARSLSFEPNRGQTDSRVDFLAHGAGYGLFLSHAEAIVILQHGTHVRLRPVDANPLPQVEALHEQPSKSNYFIGPTPERWHTNIPNYSKVRYR